MISVVMPVFNEEKYIEKAINSVLNQTYSNFEFIIINDGSQDSTTEILAKYKKIDNRIRIINHSKNVGIVKALNEGLDIAEGEYIARMDGDDVCLPNRFEKQIEFLENNPEVKLVGCYIDIIDIEDNIIGEESFFTKGKDILDFSLRMRIDLQHPTVMAKREVFDNFRYRDGYIHAEDYDLFCRVVEKYKAANIPEKLLMYRRHARSVSNQNRLVQKQVASLIAQEAARRRNIRTNTEIILYSDDWHNKCFYVNYEEKLRNKKVVFIEDEEYSDWIESILVPIDACSCVGHYSIKDGLLALQEIKDNKADYVCIASDDWRAITESLIKNGASEDYLIQAFFCRKADIA